MQILPSKKAKYSGWKPGPTEADGKYTGKTERQDLTWCYRCILSTFGAILKY